MISTLKIATLIVAFGTINAILVPCLCPDEPDFNGCHKSSISRCYPLPVDADGKHVNIFMASYDIRNNITGGLLYCMNKANLSVFSGQSAHTFKLCDNTGVQCGTRHTLNLRDCGFASNTVTSFEMPVPKLSRIQDQTTTVINAYATDQATAYSKTKVYPAVIHFNFKPHLGEHTSTKYVGMSSYTVYQNYKMSINIGCRCPNRGLQCVDMLATINGTKRCFSTIYDADDVTFPDIDGDHMTAKLLFDVHRTIYPHKQFIIARDPKVSGSEILCSHASCDESLAIKIYEVTHFDECYRGKGIVTPTNEVFIYPDGSLPVYDGAMTGNRFGKTYLDTISDWLEEHDKVATHSDNIINKREQLRKNENLFKNSFNWLVLLIGTGCLTAVIIGALIVKMVRENKYLGYKKLDGDDDDDYDDDTDDEYEHPISNGEVANHLITTNPNNPIFNDGGFARDEFDDDDDDSVVNMSVTHRAKFAERKDKPYESEEECLP